MAKFKLCEDSEELYNCDFYLDPEDNDGKVTREIYNEEDNPTLLYYAAL